MSRRDEDEAVEATARLRRADVWTGLVLIGIALLMIVEALTYPLEGTYAGVRNAWYVSPALLPLIVGGALLVLSTGLLVVALGERARLAPGRPIFSREGSDPSANREASFIAMLLAAYIVGLIPRVDFIASTALFLLVFMAAYVVEARGSARMAIAACLVAPALLALLAALAGWWPPPRSQGQFVLDAAVSVAIVAAYAMAWRAARSSERRRLKSAASTALLTAVLLAALFRHGLLTPLPREGLWTVLMERVAVAIASLSG
jgi:hypothetical protein